MLRSKITKRQCLVATIAISGAFFIASSPSASGPAQMNDLIGFSMTLFAVILSGRKMATENLTFGWKRAQVLGGFFKGVFLLALGVSILLQAIERFINLSPVEEPVLILTMGCIGLGLNVLVLGFLHEPHEHDHNHNSTETHLHERTSTPPSHSPQASPSHQHPPPPATKPPRDLGMLGDALNNTGVIIAALVVWKGGPSERRFYADPAVSLFIALTIALSAWPLCRRAGHILLESAPPGTRPDELRKEISLIAGVADVQDLRVWRVDQATTFAIARVGVVTESLAAFEEVTRAVEACLKLRGVHVSVLQPISKTAERKHVE
ncbi:Zinc/cadmium resistance protein [Colletotrichum spinosum]|uniref:Zinc/cadmium resistance protein n=1 Tax=Colletotrichum spinosum TaxID=1347390 RepID=A0A4R8QA07_9PEZI|nr:Zinc/cadmium resistance protein [Colletotrichum spinosum]